MSLSEEEKSEARGLFSDGDGNRVCYYCGGVHARACLRVAEFELYENGKLKRVKYWAAGEWDDSTVIWPEDVFAETEAEEDENG